MQRYNPLVFSILILLTALVASESAAQNDPVAIVNLSPQRPNNLVYAGETFVLDGSASYDPDPGGTITYYEWQEPCCGEIGSGSSLSSITYSFGSTGTKQISLRVGDNENPQRFNTVTLTFDVQPAPGRYYYVTDHLGSVRATVDENGNLVGYDDYYPFGLQMAGRSGVGDDKTREKFTGHELDEDTGLVYAGARYYMPEVDGY